MRVHLVERVRHALSPVADLAPARVAAERRGASVLEAPGKSGGLLLTEHIRSGQHRPVEPSPLDVGRPGLAVGVLDSLAEHESRAGGCRMRFAFARALRLSTVMGLQTGPQGVGGRAEPHRQLIVLTCRGLG